MHGQRGLAPLGKEAFSLLVQFYEYDRNVPLDARVYERKVHEVFIREKVVFRGVRDSLDFVGEVTMERPVRQTEIHVSHQASRPSARRRFVVS